MSVYKSRWLASVAQLPMPSVVSTSAIVLIMLEILLYSKSDLSVAGILTILFTLCSVTALSPTIVQKERHSRAKF
jgi:hypothetical protein